MTTRRELTEAIGARSLAASKSEKQKILDEFVALTGYHRKHAIRTLNGQAAAAVEEKRRNRVYDEATRQALIMLWEAADRVCGKRLKALVPMLTDAMERHGHIDLDPIVKAKVLTVSAATIDRMLAGTRLQIDGQRKRRKGVGAAIRRSIPMRTFADRGGQSCQCGVVGLHDPAGSRRLDVRVARRSDCECPSYGGAWVS
jgi:hypothetical protein